MLKKLTARLMKGGAGAPLPSLRVAVPDGVRVYAIGDVHGCVKELRQLLEMIQADCKGFRGIIRLLMMGDYIDRGPDSAGVVEMLVRGLPKDWEPSFLRGNHEQAMLDFLDDPRGSPMWLSWGGIQALESYGIQPYGARGVRDADALAAELRLELEERGHADFYARTVLQEVVGGYLFVHAGVRPGVKLNAQIADDLLFIREDFLKRAHGLPYKIVFGHTIFDTVLLEEDKIGVDTGAFMSGRLSAVVLEKDTVRVLQTA